MPCALACAAVCAVVGGLIGAYLYMTKDKRQLEECKAKIEVVCSELERTNSLY